MSYNRQFVSQQLLLPSQAAEIPASLCFGREGNNDAEKDLVLSFFITRSDDELREISDFVAENYKGDEVLVSFFFKKSDGSAYTLSSDEAKSFDFRNYPYEISKLCTSWDELREIDQEVMGITFSMPD